MEIEKQTNAIKTVIIDEEIISKKCQTMSCRFEVAKTALAVLNDNGFCRHTFLPLLFFLQKPHYLDFLPYTR